MFPDLVLCGMEVHMRAASPVILGAQVVMRWVCGSWLAAMCFIFDGVEESSWLYGLAGAGSAEADMRSPTDLSRRLRRASTVAP